MQKEAKSRIKINNLLQESGWRFFDDEKDKANIVLENNAKLTKQTIDEFGNDFEKTKKGFIDFLLLDDLCEALHNSSRINNLIFSRQAINFKNLF